MPAKKPAPPPQLAPPLDAAARDAAAAAARAELAETAEGMPAAEPQAPAEPESPPPPRPDYDNAVAGTLGGVFLAVAFGMKRAGVSPPALASVQAAAREGAKALSPLTYPRAFGGWAFGSFIGGLLSTFLAPALYAPPSLALVEQPK